MAGGGEPRFSYLLPGSQPGLGTAAPLPPKKRNQVFSLNPFHKGRNAGVPVLREPLQSGHCKSCCQSCCYRYLLLHLQPGMCPVCRFKDQSLDPVAFGSSLRLMPCISAAQLISIFKVPHQPLNGEGEAKLLEGNKPNQNNPQQQEAGNVKKYFSLEAAGWHEGCCKGRE